MNYQIALIDRFTWAAFGPGCCTSGLFQFGTLPEVSCPILDIRDCDPARVSAACLGCHPSPELNVNVERLIRGLVKAGAKQVIRMSLLADEPVLESSESRRESVVPDRVFLDFVEANP
jgi:hypothetical protein